MADLINTCQSCGAEESLDALLQRMVDDDTVRRLVADVVTVSLPLGGMVVRYLRLHKPLKQKLRLSVVSKLLGELVPDLQRNVIERNGRGWAVTPEDWRGAFQVVFDAVDKGTLVPPLQGNGYLYSVLMRKSDRSEAQGEAQAEADKRLRPQRDTVQVQGQTLSIGEALQVVHGDKNLALAERDEANRNAAPMPAALRELQARLKGVKP